jgi:hypothetical protein
MVQTVSNYDASLKEFYEGAIRTTINNSVEAFKMLDTSSKPWSGRHVRFPVKLSRNSAVGARSEGGTLPAAGNQGYGEARITSTYQYGRIQVSGPVMEAGKNAFAGAMEQEMQGVTSDLINDLGRQTWGYGDGRLCRVATSSTAATGSTIGVQNRFLAPGHPGARYLYVGQQIDGGTVAVPTTAFASETITALTISTNPATTEDTVGTTSGMSAATSASFLFNQGAGGAGVELQGIQGLIDDVSATNIFSSTGFLGSAVQNINRGANAGYNAIVLGNSSVARTIDGYLMQTAFDKIETEGGAEANLIWGHHSVITAFQESIAGDRRYAGNLGNAGFTSLSYNGVPMKKDRQAPYNQLLVMNKDVLKLYKLSDFKFADNDGAILKNVSGQDNWEAFIRAYLQLGLDGNPRQAVMIRDIQTDL